MTSRSRPIFICGGDPNPPLRDPNRDCPNSPDHVHSPAGYIEWHDWAARMARTHVQSRCPGCGLWLIVTPKDPKPAPG